AFALMADVEGKISVNDRQAAQALYVAEGGTWLVRNWFEDPTGTGYLVPTTSQVNRTARWVDDDYDGTYEAYTAVSAPWNVTYRQGTNDLFQKPYRGTPSLALVGNEAHPDVLISASGSANEQAFLGTVNDTLFPNFPSVKQRALITEIRVFGPP